MIGELCESRCEGYVWCVPDAGLAARAAAKGATTAETANLCSRWNDDLRDVHPADRQVGNIYWQCGFGCMSWGGGVELRSHWFC